MRIHKTSACGALKKPAGEMAYDNGLPLALVTAFLGNLLKAWALLPEK